MPKIRFGSFEKKVILKVVILFMLLAGVLFMNFTNRHLQEKNIKMARFIKNEWQYKKENNELKNRLSRFDKYLIKISPGADLDNLKSKSTNEILELLLKYGLRADSYDSQMIEDDGFVIFSYALTAFGQYRNIIEFFLYLKNKSKYMFIKKFKMNKTGSKLIRIDLNIDILGK